jgi:hypothetical protein
MGHSLVGAVGILVEGIRLLASGQGMTDVILRSTITFVCCLCGLRHELKIV